MKIFGKNNQDDQDKEKSGKLDVNKYSKDERYDLEILKEQGKQAREKREGLNSLLLQGTSSIIALMAAIALFILPVSNDVKSHAKDILIFIGGGASGYVIKEANKKNDKDAE
ncbi:hypothetical protein C7H19_12050 [Aphanothece hegewaldii CCALA 016]|uniref:Uncharacterized protein n=1 Tax=Aphanothece hegewaldii CCALA 016 TaxID=2107694 RepID=A0A2T1LXQ4_9CHRO|nr:hypothetical protein [Aphanothece hegewaldii]PSF37160.1 hypothetical protein C7H19_12050 [Aphanothece hegewaldii CCALA 016]